MGAMGTWAVTVHLARGYMSLTLIHVQDTQWEAYITRLLEFYPRLSTGLGPKLLDKGTVENGTVLVSSRGGLGREHAVGGNVLSVSHLLNPKSLTLS